MLRRAFCLHNLSDVLLSELSAAAFFGLLCFPIPVLFTMCHGTASIARSSSSGWFPGKGLYHSSGHDGGGGGGATAGDASCSR
jgi:uncharacterized membrane protein